jgi:N-carbamoyl-L-amino-acid hydrolase
MEIKINAERLHASLHELAQIGATPGGGVTRLALTDEDKAGRDLLRRWFTEAGLEVRVDDLGNMIGHRAGTDPGPPVLLGSHCDSVVRGGKFDGALGVQAALEVMRTLNDQRMETRKPLAVVNWTNEEGVRFEPAMTCAGVVAGRFTRDYVYNRTDRQGIRFEEELRRIGYLGDEANRPLPAAAYLELHIEQGPVLDDEELPVGVVDGIVGISWSEVTIEGQADHAGPSPMRLRRDALVAAAIIIQRVESIAKGKDDNTVATVGRLVAEPNIINTIPGKVTFSVDFRHPDPVILEGLVEEMRSMVEEVAAERGVGWSVEPFWLSEPTPFAADVVSAVKGACETLGLPVRHLWSGAGHDAKYVADVCPAGMIFVRSRGGLSHCEEELSAPEDIEAGANVLLRAALALADAS